MNGDGQTFVDERLWTSISGRRGPDGLNEWTERPRTSDKMVTDIGWNINGHQTEWRQTLDRTKWNKTKRTKRITPATTLQSVSHPRALQ